MYGKTSIFFLLDQVSLSNNISMVMQVDGNVSAAYAFD